VWSDEEREKQTEKYGEEKEKRTWFWVGSPLGTSTIEPRKIMEANRVGKEPKGFDEEEAPGERGGSSGIKLEGKRVSEKGKLSKLGVRHEGAKRRGARSHVQRRRSRGLLVEDSKGKKKGNDNFRLRKSASHERGQESALQDEFKKEGEKEFQQKTEPVLRT